MEREARFLRHGHEHPWLFRGQLDQLRSFICRWCGGLTVSDRFTVHVHLRPLCNYPMASRVPEVRCLPLFRSIDVSPITDLLCHPKRRWLMQKGYEKEAIEILSCIEDKPIDDPYVVAQKNEIEYTIYYERDNAIRWDDILLCRKTDSTDSKSLRRLILGAGTQFMQQFECINLMSYYLPTVLMKFVGLSDSMVRLLTAVNSVTYLICTCCAVGLIERMGRRGLMMLFTAGQFFAFLNITILLRYAEANAGTV